MPPPGSTSHWLSQQHLVVSGLGISGTCFVVSLLQACHRHGIQSPKVSVYERDAELDTNFYSIGIRSDKASGGLQVLQKLGLFDTAARLHHIPDDKKFSILCGDGTHVMTKSQTPLTENLRLSRYALRKLLLDALPKSVDIHWGSPIVKVEPQDRDNTVKCYLADGSIVDCNIVVAADGSMSKARQSIHPNLWPQYNGMRFLFARTLPGSKLDAPYNEHWGGTISGDGHFLFVTAPEHETTLLALGWKAPRTSNTYRPGQATEQQVDEFIAEMREHSKHLGPGFQSLIECIDRKSVWRRNTYEMLSFENTGNVICIGDANHAMSPTAGNGANMALMDGYELAHQLVEHDALKSALLAYDKQAMPRSNNSIKMSRIAVFVLTSRVMYYVIKVVATVTNTMSWLLAGQLKSKAA